MLATGEGKLKVICLGKQQGEVYIKLELAKPDAHGDYAEMRNPGQLKSVGVKDSVSRVPAACDTTDLTDY